MNVIGIVISAITSQADDVSGGTTCQVEFAVKVDRECWVIERITRRGIEQELL